MRSLTFLLFFALGCSLIINPDESQLGGLDGGSRDSGVRDSALFDGNTGRDASSSECPRAPSCEANALVYCQDGVLLYQDCGLEVCDAEGQSCNPAWRPSNVDAAFWNPAATSIRVEGERIVDTSECGEGSVVSLGGVVEACVFSVDELQIREGGTLRINGDRPAIIIARGDVRINGTLDVSAYGTQPGPGGYEGGGMDSLGGQGPRFGEGGIHIDSYRDGGGGGGAFCGSGGNGGSGGIANGGEGGKAFMVDYDLQPLLGGSGGGRGRGDITRADHNAGWGGAGGGAIQISSLRSITIGGAVLAGGGGGEGGRNVFDTDANWGSGGGGGAGGGILLEARRIVIRDGILSAGGGGGGGGAGIESGRSGEDGAQTESRAEGGEGGPDELGMRIDGGEGGGAMQISGDRGESDTDAPSNGAGGGGGAGCIVLRADEFPSVLDRFIVTPSIAPGYKLLPLQR